MKDSIRVVGDMVLIIRNDKAEYYQMDEGTTVTIDGNNNIKWNGEYHPIERDTFIDATFSGVLTKLRQSLDVDNIKEPPLAQHIKNATNVDDKPTIPSVRVFEEVFKRGIVSEN